MSSPTLLKCVLGGFCFIEDVKILKRGSVDQVQICIIEATSEERDMHFTCIFKRSFSCTIGCACKRISYQACHEDTCVWHRPRIKAWPRETNTNIVTTPSYTKKLQILSSFIIFQLISPLIRGQWSFTSERHWTLKLRGMRHVCGDTSGPNVIQLTPRPWAGRA